MVHSFLQLINRKLGPETARSHQKRIVSGFYDKYMSGNGLDIGFRGSVQDAQSVLPSAIGVDSDYPGYDNGILPFVTESMDYVFSSHCLEHISDYKQAIQEWYRVLKVGGHMIVSVPSRERYEKRLNPPSKWNGDHKRFYSPHDLLREINESLEPNTWRLRICQDNDDGWDATKGPDVHSVGAYDILAVIQKVEKPDWDLA